MKPHSPTRKAPRRTSTTILLAVAFTASALLLILHHDPALLAWETAWHKLLSPLLRMLCYLGAGLVVGLVVEGMGWAPLLARFVRPLMRFGKLNDESGAAFTTAFVSGTAANAMLMSFWQDGKLTQQEMRFSYLVNTGLPVFLLHLPTTFFIVVPLTGNAGILYLLLNGIAALLRTLGVLGWTRFHIARPEGPPASATMSSERPTAPPEAAQNTARNSSSAQQNDVAKTKRIASLFRKRFMRIVTITAPIYFLMFALTQAGLFEALRQFCAQWVSSELLPVEAASVVVFAVTTEFTSGIAAAAALLHSGTLTTEQTVLALIFGTIIATPVRALRHQLPSHAGIFSPALGLRLLLQSQLLRIGSLGAVTVCWLYIAGLL